MHTGYFARLKDYKYPISICGKAPDFYTGPQLKILAPKFWFFKEFKDQKSEHYLDIDFYTKNFKLEVLDKLQIENVIQRIQNIYPNVSLDDITLICYEKPSDFCHRHLVANWLTENGYACSEW